MKQKIPGQILSGFRFCPKLSGFLLSLQFNITVHSKWCHMMILHVNNVARTSGSGFFGQNPVFWKPYFWSLHNLRNFLLKKISRTKFVRDPVLPENVRFHKFYLMNHIGTQKTMPNDDSPYPWCPPDFLNIQIRFFRAKSRFPKTSFLRSTHHEKFYGEFFSGQILSGIRFCPRMSGLQVLFISLQFSFFVLFNVAIARS